MLSLSSLLLHRRASSSSSSAGQACSLSAWWSAPRGMSTLLLCDPIRSCENRSLSRRPCGLRGTGWPVTSPCRRTGNTGPADLLDFGLPEGFIDRLETHSYGDYLAVYFASRFDQIHFKFYAAVDQGPGKHSEDLEALAPTREELLRAARWARTHDPSPGFERELRRALAHFGVDDGDL